MSNSLSLIAGVDIKVDDLPALSLSPEGVRALPVISGPRLAVTGRIGPKWKCGDCRDFERVITRTGVAICTSPVHAADKPKLPMRPTPHERDGRQDSPQPARPHSLLGV
ncbi:hypothetical protein [Streptomyces rugosispiralis]|uniref:Transposase n=1 Tax=Streptomyces rugosispiralis TaxID=2967341 RepID=A0ABT1VBA7_9ACTN|nr:hypothetical protein [Streptomyces rugosispiralis]MCQ8194674.1 hypothetical protein [Streptomyces rugosispiralis]